VENVYPHPIFRSRLIRRKSVLYPNLRGTAYQLK